MLSFVILLSLYGHYNSDLYDGNLGDCGDDTEDDKNVCLCICLRVHNSIIGASLE